MLITERNKTISISGTYNSADTLTFCYILINHGGSSTQEVITHCLNAISNSELKNFSSEAATPVSVNGTELPMCLSSNLRAKDNMNASWNLIKSYFQHMDTNHCDGPVAIDAFSFTGTELDNIILVSQEAPFSIIYLRTDSAIGCGSNSDYTVQWSVGIS